VRTSAVTSEGNSVTRHFCTYCDHRYLPRALTMYRSLKSHCPTARLWVLCLSPECYQALVRLDWTGIVPIRLEEFERNDKALRSAKANRSLVEYYFTCTPSLPLYVFEQDPAIDLITYLDSDLYFFSDPEPIYEEMGSNSIALIPHRFPPQDRWMERNGVFNVGWLSFRRDTEGLASLNWWREKCLEWCHDYIEQEKFADQKYLDRFPELFKNLKVIEHKGANLAAWNLRNYNLRSRFGTLSVDHEPVLFFHFQGLRKIAPGVVDPCVQFYSLRVSWLMEWGLFRPYMGELREARQLVSSTLGSTGLFAGLEREESNLNQAASRLKDRQIAARLKRLLAPYRGVLARKFLVSFD
jgi:hypothetical protein